MKKLAVLMIYFTQIYITAPQKSVILPEASSSVLKAPEVKEVLNPEPTQGPKDNIQKDSEFPEEQE